MINKKKNIIENFEMSLKIYDLIKKVPPGKVTTYGELAKSIGKYKSSRVIGKILNKNPFPINIPCHRVVLSNGKIGGYYYGTEIKKRILEKEGLKISAEGKIHNFYAVKKII